MIQHEANVTLLFSHIVKSNLYFSIGFSVFWVCSRKTQNKTSHKRSVCLFLWVWGETMFRIVQSHTHVNTQTNTHTPALLWVEGWEKEVCWWRWIKEEMFQAKSFCLPVSLSLSLSLSVPSLCWSPEWHLALSCSLASSWQPNHLLSRSAINLRSVSLAARLLSTASVLGFFSRTIIRILTLLMARAADSIDVILTSAEWHCCYSVTILDPGLWQII